MSTSEAERSVGNIPKDMAYSNVAPIPLYKEQGPQKSYSDRSGSVTGDALRKAQRNSLKLSIGGTRLGEELVGLTPNHRV